MTVKKALSYLAITILSFGAGFGAGVIFEKRRYEKNLNDEIEPIRQKFAEDLNKLKNQSKSNESSEEPKSDISEEPKPEHTVIKKDDDDINIAASNGSSVDYVSFYTSSDPELHVEHGYSSTPVIVSPEEFADDGEYSFYTFFYYTDGVVLDDADDPVEDLTDCIGDDALNHFGEYDPDTVYIRNDKKKAYYEIIKDARSSTDVRKREDL